MKNIIRTFVVLAGLGTLSSLSNAAPCDNSNACNSPTSNGTAGWSSSASGLSGLTALVNANASGARYYFAASNTDLGATTAKGSITTTGTGTEVIGSFSFGGAVNVTGGAVQNLLGNITYFVYVQACGSTESLDSGHCSAWVQVGSKATLAYPVSVFNAVVKPTDATSSSIDSRTNVPVADANFISQIQYEVDDLITPARDQSGIVKGWTGNGTYTISNADYTTTFVPNTKYQYKGQVFYPYGVAVPTAGAQTEGPFWTTPVNPGTVTTANRTHCSIQITAQNSGGAPGNPSYTTYNLCATGTGGSCGTSAISGATPTDTAVVTISGLNPGTAYTPTAQALVGNGDGSSSGWNSSGVTNGTGFSTRGFAGTFSITSIMTNDADFTFTSLDLTGVTGYQMIVNGSNFGATVNTPPVSPIHLSGLTPNTQYAVQIELIEASCNSTLPTTPSASGTQFYTLPAAPTAPDNLSATAPRVIFSSWTDAAVPTGNPNGSTYLVKYCLDAGFGSGCNTQSATKSNTTPSTNLTTGVIPETPYFAEVKTIGLGGTDSGWLNLGTVTTPNEAPTVATLSCAAPGLSTTICNGSGTDNGALNQLTCHWTINNGASLVSTQDQNADAGGNCPAVTFSFPDASLTYTVGLVVTDHNGTGLASPLRTTTFSGTQTATTITLAPNTPIIVGRGQSASFMATVFDQFHAAIAGAPVTWSITAGGGSFSPAGTTSGGSTSLTVSNTLGSYTVSAVDGAASSSTVVNVQANTVVVSPASPVNVGTGGSQSFTDVVTNPQGTPISPTITWSVSACNSSNTISAGGVFSATTADTTPCVITATTQYGDTGTAHITVDNSLPQITVQPTATVFATSATLTVSGTGFNGPSKLTYTWSVVSPTGASVDFSSQNGTITGHDVTATFHAIGTYVFKATLSDIGTPAGTTNPPSNSANTGNVVVTPILTSIKVSPDGITIQALNAQTFTASGTDQFHNATSAGNVIWSTSNGNISGAGVFNSPSLGSNITVRARNGAIVGAATVNVISYDISGAHPYPVPFKSTRDSAIHFVGLGSSAKIRIYTVAGREVFSTTVDNADPVVGWLWDVKNNSGDKLASGVYFYFIESPAGKKDGKLIIIQ